MKNRVVFREKDVIIVITSGKTRNKKIAPENVDIIQTYTYSREQFLRHKTKRLCKLSFQKIKLTAWIVPLL